MTQNSTSRSHAFRLGLWLGLLIGAIAALLGRADTTGSASKAGAGPAEVPGAHPTVKVSRQGGSPL